MLKVKETIQNPKNKIQDNLTELPRTLKILWKSYILAIKKKNKTINEYAELLTKIRNECAKSKKENNELKIELHKYQNYFQNIPQKSYQKPSYTKPIRKRKHYYYDEPEESEESDSYVTEIPRRPKKQKKRIIYEDEIDRIPEYETDSPTEEEQEEDNNYEIQNKYKGKQLKQIEKPKKVKKGITKSIKM